MMQSSLRIFSGIWALSLSGALSALPDCPSDLYEAEWHNCFGTHTFANGDKYVGEWKEDKKHGQGTYTFASGAKYVGEYKEGKYHGQGTATLAAGDKYVGEYKEGKHHGQGTYTWADGSKYVGEYKEGKEHGQGTYTWADGRVERGYYMNREYVPEICQGMGLTKGTEAFGNCVLKLIDEVTKDD